MESATVEIRVPRKSEPTGARGAARENWRCGLGGSAAVRPRARNSLLGEALAPLREAIGQALDKEREARWFPVLSTPAMTLCGIVSHVFGLSSMRAVVEKAEAELSETAGELRGRIAEWRGTRGTSAERMPERLWAEAARLARVYGGSRVARALRLDYGALKRRVVGKGGRAAQDQRRAGAGDAMEFRQEGRRIGDMLEGLEAQDAVERAVI